jgi:transposase
MLCPVNRPLSGAQGAAIKSMLVLMGRLINRVSLNSKNSSKPPSTDGDKGKGNDGKKHKKNDRDKRKPGGQPGRTSTQLKRGSSPDEVKVLEIDKSTLPKRRYKKVGYESRQVIDFKISLYIVEYRAQILEDANGKQYVAKFPSFVTRPVQYGPKTKAIAVYMTQYQFLPYHRNLDYFASQLGLNLSPGSLFNFNKEAYALLERFEQISKERLINSPCVNSDEMGINVAGKRKWLHTACNEEWTHFSPHDKRGAEAMDDIGILPRFKGFLCHDHWKAYFKYDRSHVLCNAHHLRELEWSATEDKQQWVTQLRDFLKQLNIKVKNSGGSLTKGKRGSAAHEKNQITQFTRKVGYVPRGSSALYE